MFYSLPPSVPISRIPAPRHIFIEDIVIPEVKALFERLVGLEGNPEGDGTQYFADSEEGMILMGTAHGKSVG